MDQATIDQADVDLAQLVDRVQHGETIVIARNGKAVARVSPVPEARTPHPRLGFLKGKGTVPVNWKEIAREEIEREFYGEE